MEHENLISDSEYITLNHQTGENVTHIKTATLKEKLDDLQQTKQNKLTAMGGISITGDNILLTGIDNFRGDLNNLTDTCTVKPDDGTPNLPTGVRGHGILTAFRINDVISQKYHALDNNMYVRICRYVDSVPTWTPWVKLVTTAI